MVKSNTRNGERKATSTKGVRGSRNPGRSSRGGILGLDSVLYILQQILETENLDEGLQRVAEYMKDLFDLHFTVLLLRDGRTGSICIRSLAAENGVFQFLKNLSYQPGSSREIDDWLSEIFDSPGTVQGKKCLERIYRLAAGAGIITRAALNMIVKALASPKEMQWFPLVARDRAGAPYLMLFIGSENGISRSEQDLIRKITSVFTLAIERRMELEGLELDLDLYQALIECREHAFFLIEGGKLKHFSEHLPGILEEPPGNLQGSALEGYLETADRKDMKEIVHSFLEGDASTGKRYYHVYRLARSRKEIEVFLNVSEFNGKRVLRGTVVDASHRSILEKSILEEKHRESIATLAGGVAHDFNNLIGAMVGYASLLRNSPSGHDERTRYIDKIEEAGARATRLAQRLLSVSRKGKFQREIVDMTDILDRVCKSSTLPMDHVSVVKEVSAGHMNVEGDPTQLYEAFLNLCMNAREAMPRGGLITVTARNVRLDRENPVFTDGMPVGEYVRICVKDQGAGMEPEVLRRAVDPFFTTKREKGGKGLGVPAAVGIVKGHRGKMFLTSRFGEGTEAVVFLPVTMKRPREIVTSAVMTREAGRRVLVVDDEEIVCSLASDMLANLGYETVTALSGGDALALAGTMHFDLVILDLVMPEMNGQEVFYCLKESNPQLPVIISSGYSEDSVIHKLLIDGAVCFLKKPYRLNDLSLAIRNAVGNISREREGMSGHGN